MPSSWHLPSSTLSQPEVGFTVVHRHVDPIYLQSASHIHTSVIGTYSSLTSAQKGAKDALSAFLEEYKRVGFRGNVASAIDLVYRGLITRIDENGVEHPLSEFQIHPQHIWSDTWAPQMGGEEERVLLQTLDDQGGKGAKVGLPSEQYLVSCERQSDAAETVQQSVIHSLPKEEENQHWAQSRIPLIRGRYDTPLRSEWESPYEHTFGPVGRFAQSREQSLGLSYDTEVRNQTELNRVCFSDPFDTRPSHHIW